jgi:hypothetical protein
MLRHQRGAGVRRPATIRLPADEWYGYNQLTFSTSTALAHAREMKNRPQTLHGIEDSSVGLATWMLDHRKEPTASSFICNRLPKGRPLRDAGTAAALRSRAARGFKSFGRSKVGD